MLFTVTLVQSILDRHVNTSLSLIFSYSYLPSDFILSFSVPEDKWNVDLSPLPSRSHLDTTNGDDSGQTCDTESDVELNPVADVDESRRQSILNLENDNSGKVEILEGAADESRLSDNVNVFNSTGVKSLSSLVPPSCYEEELVYSPKGDIKLEVNSNAANESNEDKVPSNYEEETYEEELIVLPLAFSGTSSRKRSTDEHEIQDLDPPIAIVIDYASRSDDSSRRSSGERFVTQELDFPTAIVIDYASKSDDSRRSSGEDHTNQQIDSPSGVIICAGSGSSSRRSSEEDHMNQELGQPTAIVIDYATMAVTYDDNERDSFWDRSYGGSNDQQDEGYHENVNSSKDQYGYLHLDHSSAPWSEGIIQNTDDGMK